MKKAHRMTAQVNQVIISKDNLKKGKISKAISGIVDYANIHSDGSMTGIVRSLNNQAVSFNKTLKVWEY